MVMLVLMILLGLTEAGEFLESHRLLGDLRVCEHPVDHLLLERRGLDLPHRVLVLQVRAPRLLGVRDSSRPARSGAPARARARPVMFWLCTICEIKSPSAARRRAGSSKRSRGGSCAGIADAHAPRRIQLQLLHLLVDQRPRQLAPDYRGRARRAPARARGCGSTPASSRSMLLRTSARISSRPPCSTP